MGEGFGPTSSDVTDFVDSPWEASPSLRNEWGKGGEVGRRKREGTGIGM